MVEINDGEGCEICMNKSKCAMLSFVALIAILLMLSRYIGDYFMEHNYDDAAMVGYWISSEVLGNLSSTEKLALLSTDNNDIAQYYRKIAQNPKYFNTLEPEHRKRIICSYLASMYISGQKAEMYRYYYQIKPQLGINDLNNLAEIITYNGNSTKTDYEFALNECLRYSTTKSLRFRLSIELLNKLGKESEKLQVEAMYKNYTDEKKEQIKKAIQEKRKGEKE